MFMEHEDEGCCLFMDGIYRRNTKYELTGKREPMFKDRNSLATNTILVSKILCNVHVTLEVTCMSFSASCTLSCETSKEYLFLPFENFSFHLNQCSQFFHNFSISFIFFACQLYLYFAVLIQNFLQVFVLLLINHFFFKSPLFLLE